VYRRPPRGTVALRSAPGTTETLRRSYAFKDHADFRVDGGTVSSDLVDRAGECEAPQGWLPVRVRGVRFAVPPRYVVEGSRATVRAWNRRDEPDRALLLQIDPSAATLRRHAARVLAAAEANGDRVVAESEETLEVVPAVRAVLERLDGGTSVTYLAVFRGLAWDLRVIVAPFGGPDAVVEFERIVATFRFDGRPSLRAPTAGGVGSSA
jgi:hypothetical protein